jgi:hypothetical protein
MPPANHPLHSPPAQLRPTHSTPAPFRPRPPYPPPRPPPPGVVKRIEAALGGALDAPPSIHYVRDVAPNKIMLCVSFKVPAAVAFAGRGAGGEQQAKKQKLDG